MSQYYYAVAALPFLLFDQEQSADVEEFLDFCSRQLSEKDYSILSITKIEDFPAPHYSNPLVEEWQNWEKALRNALVFLRAQGLGIEPIDVVPSEDFIEVQDIAREAFSQDSPLQAELVLLRARWTFLEEKEVGHFFDLEKLLIYYLKLQLLQRKNMFHKEYGKEQFDTLYEKIENNFYNSEQEVE